MFILASNPTWNIGRESFSTCMYNLHFLLLIVKLQALYHIPLYIPLTLLFSSVYSLSFTLLYTRRKAFKQNSQKNELKLKCFFFSLTPWKLGKLQKAKWNFYSLLFYAWDCWQILIISIRIIHIFIFFVVCNYFRIIFVLYFNFISARTLINTLLLTHSRTKPAVPWLHTVGSTTNNRENIFLKVD